MNQDIQNILIRDFELKDSDSLFNWRNSIEARDFSRNTQEVSPNEHVVWVEDYFRDLKSGFRKISIFEVGGNSVGMIRLDRLNEIHFEISILVNPDYRNLGLGKVMLQIFLTKHKKKLENRQIFAYIHEENISSKKIFEDNGFQILDSSEVFHKYGYLFQINSKNL